MDILQLRKGCICLKLKWFAIIIGVLGVVFSLHGMAMYVLMLEPKVNDQQVIYNDLTIGWGILFILLTAIAFAAHALLVVAALEELAWVVKIVWISMATKLVIMIGVWFINFNKNTKDLINPLLFVLITIWRIYVIICVRSYALELADS